MEMADISVNLIAIKVPVERFYTTGRTVMTTGLIFLTYPKATGRNLP